MTGIPRQEQSAAQGCDETTTCGGETGQTISKSPVNEITKSAYPEQTGDSAVQSLVSLPVTLLVTRASTATLNTETTGWLQTYVA